jgi:hypothetical protein
MQPQMGLTCVSQMFLITVKLLAILYIDYVLKCEVVVQSRQVKDCS